MGTGSLKELQRKVKKAELYEFLKNKVWDCFDNKVPEDLYKEVCQEVVVFCEHKIEIIANPSPLTSKRPSSELPTGDPGELIRKNEEQEVVKKPTDQAGRPVDEYGDPMDPIAFSMKYIRKAKISSDVMLKTGENQEIQGKLINAAYPHLIIKLEDGREIPALRSDVRFLREEK